MRALASLQTLQRSSKQIFSLSDLRKLLGMESDNTAYKRVQVLIEAGILTRIMKGYFMLAANRPSNLAIANVLYRPSYISLETALNYYGMLIQVPQQVTSVTTNMSKERYVEETPFTYAHLDKRYFTGYQRVESFLIATPEKALVDTVYFVAQRRRMTDLSELQLDQIDFDQVRAFADSIANRAFRNAMDRFLTTYVR